MDTEPQDDEDDREMKPADWTVLVGPREQSDPKGERTIQSNSHTFRRLVHTSHEGSEDELITTPPMVEVNITPKANNRDGLLLHETQLRSMQTRFLSSQ